MAEARRLAMFPLSTVLFPYAPLPIHVFEPRYRAMTEECLAGDREFGVVLIDRGSEVGGGDHRVSTGTVAYIHEAARLADGRWVLIAEGQRRLEVAEWLPEDPYPVALVTDRPAGGDGDPDVLARAAASVRRARALLSELGRSPAPQWRVEEAGEPEMWGWRLCAEAPLSLIDRQRLLETDDPDERLRLLADLSDEVATDLNRMLAGPEE